MLQLPDGVIAMLSTAHHIFVRPRLAYLAMARIAMALCASAALSVAAQGQQPGTVRGWVRAADGRGVAGARVSLSEHTGRTNEAGAFLLSGVRPGRAALRIQAIGFVTVTHDIIVHIDSGWTGSITLDRLAQLPPIQVTDSGGANSYGSKYDDFFRRRRQGMGIFRTREDFEKLGSSDIVSALQGIPGVRLSATSSPHGAPEIRFRMARCPGNPPNIAIYINNSRVSAFGKNENRGSELTGLTRRRQSEDSVSTCEDCTRIAEILNSIALQDVLFVEFYRGAGEVPGDLGRGDSCASLVVWTR